MAWKTIIRETQGIFEGVDDEDEQQVRDLALKVAKILEDAVLAPRKFDAEERAERDEFVERLREDVWTADDFNELWHQIYDWADRVRIWIEPPF